MSINQHDLVAGPNAKRLRAFAPHGHLKKTMSFLGTLRCDQLTGPCVSGRPINGECIQANIEQRLVPMDECSNYIDNAGYASVKNKALLMALCRPENEACAIALQEVFAVHQAG